ncbi:MAG: universal stress protein [Proteobacteria bacterium]|nr:universal stress protein [Pseudomonadota bacterium]MBU1455752.1 universal stress protein [Pseudomonadota bacterium]
MKRFKNILLVADGTHWQDTALQRAVSLAENNQADLTIISTLNLPNTIKLQGDTVYSKLSSSIINDCRNQLDEITTNSPPGVNIKSKVIEGAIFPEIIREVLRSGYDLVVKCTDETHSLKERIFGSPDMHLLRKCPCPVWLMKTKEKTKYQRILAAVDVEQEKDGKKISGLNQQILELASSLALSEFSELHIVHAWTAWGESLLNSPRFNLTNDGEVAAWVEKQRVDDETKMNHLMKALSGMLSQGTMDYLKPQLHIVKGKAHDVVPSLASEKKADLVVMGTVARTGIPGFFMGNTAENILGSLKCSVLAVKPSGFITPVTLER